ncbi:hypothetical protein MKX03_030697 [Papaver bracteatum]|nr:hypothetical protein MKX03_030697 [Papaver bracteatum]
MRLGFGTECAVCSENLVINDKMQELPCKHLFYPLCLMPWLEKHNSCPVSRYELLTDYQVYESWKESEKGMPQIMYVETQLTLDNKLT